MDDRTILRELEGPLSAAFATADGSWIRTHANAALRSETSWRHSAAGRAAAGEPLIARAREPRPGPDRVGDRPVRWDPTPVWR